MVLIDPPAIDLTNLPPMQRIATAGLALVNSVLITLWAFAIFHAIPAQQGLVFAETNAVLVLLLAVVAHYRPDTVKEPVAVAFAANAFLVTTIALLNGFHAIDWTQAQTQYVIALVASMFGLGSAFFVRQAVTPTTAKPAIDVASTVTGEVPGPDA